jgi:SAM-dependent methyltransferase
MIEHYWRSLPGWFSGRHIYAEQVRRAEDGAVFVELGAWKGRSTSFMAVEIANSSKRITFYTVDHWRGSPAEKEHDEDEDVRHGRLYEVFLQNIAPVKDYVHPIRSDSGEATRHFPDQSVDFVYVDAGHTYADVARDIAAWWPKLTPGGVLAGDDWCWTYSPEGEYGVRKAVTEFFGPRGIEVFVQPGDPHVEWEQWLAIKPRAGLGLR